MAVDGGVIIFALLIRLIVSAMVAWMAGEAGHSPIAWGALSFFLLGIWTFVVLLLWIVVTDG